MILFFSFGFSFCLDVDTNVISQKKAYEEFLIAYLYKASICQTEPGYFLILPEKVPRRWFESCLFTIIRSECPFVDYPLICGKIYEKPYE